MAVELDPLGAPELGMTRYEMWDIFYTLLELTHSQRETLLALVFAYVAASYVAAARLTKIQFAIANALYTVLTLWTIWWAWVYGKIQLSWRERIDLNPDLSAETALVWINVAVYLLLFLGSIWFAHRMRQAKPTGTDSDLEVWRGQT